MEILNKITLRQDHLMTIISHVDQEAPLEACGIVAGKDRASIQVFPISNQLASPVAYRMAPKEQLHAMLLIEENGWDLLSIYHSHPQGPAFPSGTDIAQAYYPDAVYIILSHDGNDWTCRGFSIDENGVNEVQIELVSQ